MTLDRASTGVLEKVESRDQRQTKGILCHINGWKLRTALSVGLVLGGSGLSTYTPNSPTSTAAAEEDPQASPSPREFLRRSLQETAGVSDVVLTEDGMQLRFNEQELSAQLSGLHQITSLTFRGATVTLGRALDSKTIDPVLHNLDRALAHISRQQTLDGLSIESPDGVRFRFSVENNGTTQHYVATGEDLLLIAREPTQKELKAWKDAALERNNLQQDIRRRLDTAVPSVHHTEMRLREQRISLQDRIRAIDDIIDTTIIRYREHPYRRIDWERYKADFHDDIDALWQQCQGNPTYIGLSTFESRLNQCDKELSDAEESYIWHPHEDRRFTSAQQLNILERIERSVDINGRRDAILQRLSGEHEREFLYQWNTHLASFERDYGWERWDPYSLTHDRHRTVIRELSTFLNEYEVNLKITSAHSDTDIEHSFVEEHSRLQSLVHIEEQSRENSNRYDLSGQNSRTVTEVQNLLYPSRFHREEVLGNRISISKYEKGYRYGESVYEEGRYTTYTSFYHRGSPQYRNDMRDGALIRQTWYRADGTRELVSDRETECVEYYAEDDKRLARLDVKDGGAGFTRVSFYGNDGKVFSTFDLEHEANPNLTKAQYISLLAKHLNTPQKLHAFLEIFMQYTYDDGDYWQSAQETISRVTGSRMRGDCDDYAFLAREILRQQGKNAHAVYISGHIFCLWVEQRNDGRYDVCTIGTYGYDRNGNRYGREGNPAWNDGFTTLEDGFNAVLRKYQYDNLELDENEYYTIDPSSIATVPNPRGSHKDGYTYVNIQYFLKNVR